MSSHKQPADIFLQSMVSSFALLLAGVYLLFLANKPKEDMLQVEGSLIKVERELTGHPNRHVGKLRYLQISGYNKYFEVFIGKEPGDFSPVLDSIDSLQKGDIVTVYFVEDKLSSEASQDKDINRLAQYIEKDGRTYFIRGNSIKYIGYFTLGMSVCLIVTLVILERRGTII